MTVKEYLGQAYLLDNRINSDTKEQIGRASCRERV